MTLPVADDLAIRNLAAAYSDAVGRRDTEAWRGMWAPDCVWAIRGREIRGIEEASALFAQGMDEYPRLFQTVFSGKVQLGADGLAHGVWHFFEIQRTLEGSERMVIGRYADTYAHNLGRWQFAERRFTPVYRAEIAAGLTGSPASDSRPGGAPAGAEGASFYARNVDPAVEIVVRGNVATYADAVTRRDMSQWRNTWADDGVWTFADTEFAGKEVRGGDACAEFMAETLGWFPRLLQTVLSGFVFERADGGVGGVWHIVEVQHRGPGDERLIVGRYEDTYVNQDGRWVFGERRYRRLYGAEVSEGMLALITA